MSSGFEAANATEWLGRYRLLERLGEGGMAVVWRARVEGPEGFVREVVLKRVRAAHCRDGDFVRALVHEARLSALLNHPGIVQVHELGRERDEHFLAMEYIDGCSLAALLHKTAAAARPLPIGIACHLVAELAGALAYAHELGDADGVPLHIVHRDISPSNVMIDRSGAVKLVDFGIAQAVARLSDERTRTGVLKGKLGYLAPEQIEGAAADRRSDLFALGVVFYECLTDQRLFSGSGLKALEMVRSAELLPPSVQRADIPPEVDRIALKLLARDPVARFQRGDEVQDALLGIVHRLLGDGAALARFANELGAFVAPARPIVDPAATSIRLEESDVIRERTIALGDGELSAMRAAVPRERTIALGEHDLQALQPRGERELTNVRLDALIKRDQKPESVAKEHPLDALAPKRARTGELPARVPMGPRQDGVPAPSAVAAGERAAKERTGSARRERTRTGRTAIVRTGRRSGEGAPRQLQLMAAFGIGAVAAVALPVWLMRSRPAPPAALPPPPIAAPVAAAAPRATVAPRAPDVQLIVDGEPGARLTIDGVDRGRLPITLTLPAQARERTVEIDEPGHASAVREVRGDADAQLEITLKPLAAEAPAHHAAGVARTHAPAPSPPPSAPKGAGEIESPF